MAYIRKTHDEIQVQGNYGYGWEMLTVERTMREAIAQKHCYDENEPLYSHRIKIVRVKNEEG